MTVFSGEDNGVFKSVLTNNKNSLQTPSNKRCNSVLSFMTFKLIELYSKCNSSFSYQPATENPRRSLTQPSIPVGNNGFDNENGDYIVHTRDVIIDETNGKKYEVLDMLGTGTFGQVVKCRVLKEERGSFDQFVAIKIIKNKPAYLAQSKMEIDNLKKLNSIEISFSKDSDNDRSLIVRLLHHFNLRFHLFLVLELCCVNLLELLKQNQFRGLSMNLVRLLSRQLLDGLSVISTAGIVHCDIKPENILLKCPGTAEIRIVDFGSACNVSQNISTYMQSRFYRAPEILLGLAFTEAIDIWSVGCVCAELFLGLPLFPGCNEYDQMACIVELLGVPPLHLLRSSTVAHHFFEENPISNGWKLLKNEGNKKPKRYFSFKNIDDMINAPFCEGLSRSEHSKDLASREAFLHFLSCLLCLDPARRLTAKQALDHPFITNAPFNGTWTPLPLPLPLPLQRLQESSATGIGTPAMNHAVTMPILRPSFGFVQGCFSNDMQPVTSRWIHAPSINAALCSPPILRISPLKRSVFDASTFPHRQVQYPLPRYIMPQNDIQQHQFSSSAPAMLLNHQHLCNGLHNNGVLPQSLFYPSPVLHHQFQQSPPSGSSPISMYSALSLSTPPLEELSISTSLLSLSRPLQYFGSAISFQNQKNINNYIGDESRCSSGPSSAGNELPDIFQLDGDFN